jgi:hypothetical protein
VLPLIATQHIFTDRFVLQLSVDHARGFCGGLAIDLRQIRANPEMTQTDFIVILACTLNMPEQTCARQSGPIMPAGA